MTAPTISASAIESFDPSLGGCARKWAFSRLDGVPKPQSPGAALGSRCHELWELYLRDGVPFDLSTVEGRICQATQHLLPAGGRGLVDVETSFRFEWEGVTWAGKKDAAYWERKGGTVTEEFIVGDDKTFRVVLDHKTTSDFRYAKSERTSLLGHPQAPIYALEEHEMICGRAPVRLAWNYVKHGVTFDKDAPPGPYGYTIKSARRPVAFEPPVRLIVSRAEAEDALGRFVPTAKRMLKIIQEPPAPHEGSIARQLEPNPDACEAFGGCPYRAQCGLTPQEIASRLVRSFPEENGEQKNMGSALRDRIAAIKAGNGGPVMSSAIGVQQAIQAEAAAKAQAAVVATAQEFVGDAGTVKAEPASLLPKVTAAAMQTPAAVVSVPGMQGSTTFGPVNPPEGHPALGTAMMPVETKTREELEKVYPPEPAPLSPAEAPTRPDAPQAKPRGLLPPTKLDVDGDPLRTQPDAPAPKRRGRPPGSKNKVKQEPGGGPDYRDIAAAPLAATHEVLTYDPKQHDSVDEEYCNAGPAPDTIPAPSAELLSDDVLEEVSRRVGRRLARAFLEALGDETKEDKVLA